MCLWVYVSGEGFDIGRPQLELKGFARTTLDAGETKQVNVTLDSEDFFFHDFDLKSRVPLLCADPGCGKSFVTAELYHLHVATSERHKGGPNFDELHVMLLVGCQLPIPSHLR